MTIWGELLLLFSGAVFGFILGLDLADYIRKG